MGYNCTLQASRQPIARGIIGTGTTECADGRLAGVNPHTTTPPILSIGEPQQQSTDGFYNFLGNVPRRDHIIGVPPPAAIYNLVAGWNLQQHKPPVKGLQDVMDPKSHKAVGRIKTRTSLEWDTAVVRASRYTLTAVGFAATVKSVRRNRLPSPPPRNRLTS